MTIALNEQRFRGLRARPKSRVISFEPPIQGVNTRDARDNMSPLDAVNLVNWFPEYGFLSMRPGYTQHATGVGDGIVDTIAEFHVGATQKLIAAGDDAGTGKIYDATSTGAATQLATGFSENRWNHAVMNSVMTLVNGTDAPQEYDGSTVGASTISGSGLTVTNLFDVMTFKTRNFYLENNSQSFWYSAVNAHAGVLTEFPLSRVMAFGGNLAAMATITHDAGDGADDYCAFITTAGEVIVYAGTDPASSTTWGLVGRYKIGVPIDARAKVKVGNDTLLVTGTDFIPLSRVFTQGDLILAESKISGAARNAFRDYGTNEGWEGLLYPKANMLIINIPRANGTDYYQLVQNTTTGAWTCFEDINSTTWGIYNKDAYFGKNNGIIYKFDDGRNDDGANIEAEGQSAWNHLGLSGQNKQIKAVRPIIAAEGNLVRNIGIGSDFKDIQTQSIESVASGAEWDVAEWDVAEWADENTILREWVGAEAYGVDLSMKLNIKTKDQLVKWLRNDYLVSVGSQI